MLALEVRCTDSIVKVRRFGTAEFRWTELRPGDIDRLTGWSCEELIRLGDGIWEFPESPKPSAAPSAQFNHLRA